MANDLAREVQDVLRTFGSSVNTALTDTMKIVAKETVKDLKSSSPKGKNRGKGKYARSWTFKEVSKGVFVVYSKSPEYRLTHLLENGHKTRKKTGRYGSKSFVSARPHIAQAEQRMKDRIEPTLAKQVALRAK